MATLLRLFGVLLVLSALALTLSRAPDRPVDTLVARWAPPPSDFVDLDGQLVHLRDEGPRGDPVPVVLIHGTSASLHTWDGWTAALRGTRRVIRFDLPGFGLTGPNASGDYRGDTYARFVLSLLDRLQVRRVVLAGNSLGGEVAWRVATLAPERVERLVLVDAAGMGADRRAAPAAWRIAQIPGVNRLLEHLLPRSLVAAGLHDVYGDPSRIDADLVDRYFELTLREGNRHALVLRLQQVAAETAGQPDGRAPDAPQRLRSIAVPTLLLWGGRDRLIPPEFGRRFAETIPGSRLVVFDDLGHVPHEEDAARTVQAVREFLGIGD